MLKGFDMQELGSEQSREAHDEINLAIFVDSLFLQ